MTKTFTAVGPYRLVKLVMPVIMPIGTNVARSLCLEF